MSAPRVVVVDDHHLFRAGVRAELEGLVEIVGDAATVDLAVETIAATSPDVVLLDVHMPEGGGVEVIRRVAGEQHWLFALNHTDREQCLPARGRDVLTNSTVDGVLVLPPGAVAVVAEDRLGRTG